MSLSAEERLAQLRAKRDQLAELIDRKRAVQATQFETPGGLARYTWPHVKQTPALDLLDNHLIDVHEGRIQRLAWSMPPQEGKSQRIAEPFRSGSCSVIRIRVSQSYLLSSALHAVGAA